MTITIRQPWVYVGSGHLAFLHLEEMKEIVHATYQPYKLQQQGALKIKLPGDLTMNKFKNRNKGSSTAIKVNPNEVTYVVVVKSQKQNDYTEYHKQLKKVLTPKMSTRRPIVCSIVNNYLWWIINPIPPIEEVIIDKSIAEPLPFLWDEKENF